jgi:hypothetical protein
VLSGNLDTTILYFVRKILLITYIEFYYIHNTLQIKLIYRATTYSNCEFLSFSITNPWKNEMLITYLSNESDLNYLI